MSRAIGIGTDRPSAGVVVSARIARAVVVTERATTSTGFVAVRVGEVGSAPSHERSRQDRAMHVFWVVRAFQTGIAAAVRRMTELFVVHQLSS